MQELSRKTGVSVFLMISLIVLAIILSAGGAWYYMSNQAKKVTKDKDEQIALLQKDLNKSTADLKAEQSAATASTGPATPAATSQKYQSYDVAISYSADHKIATISNNGVKAGEISTPNGELVNFLKQTNDNAYLQVVPDGIGGFILYHMSFPLYKLSLLSNTLAKISDSATGVSGSEKYVVGKDDANHKIKLLDLSTNKTQEFTVDSKYLQFGDITVSPNDKKLAYGGSYGDEENVQGDILVVEISTGKQTKINNYDLKHTAEVYGWTTNDEPDWSR